MTKTEEQQTICKRYDSPFEPTAEDAILGISKNVKEGTYPIHGLRHPPEGGTCGWYIWAGEFSADNPDFFQPLHVSHIDNWNPLIRKYLGLGSGWRFLITPDYEDVWEDLSLLHV